MKEELTYKCTKCRREVKPVFDMTKDIFIIDAPSLKYGKNNLDK